MAHRLLFLFLAPLATYAFAAEIACPAGATPREAEVSGGPAAWCVQDAAPSLLHGPYQAWHPNGTLGVYETYVQGQANGKAAYRWASGNRQAEGSFKDGLRHGPWTFWDKNGVKEGVVRFQEGRPVTGRLPRWAEDWDGSPTGLRSVPHP